MVMTHISGIVMGSYSFDVDLKDSDIQAAYLYGGGVNIWPILSDEVKLFIFDEALKDD